MAGDATTGRRWAVRALFLALVLTPVVVQWGAIRRRFLPAVDTAAVVRAVGLAALVAVVGLLVWQKRRSRGRTPSEGAPERPEDRRIEGTGEVYAPYAYNDQRRAQREGERIRERAEELAETDRESRR